jgi:hypothetical protein
VSPTAARPQRTRRPSPIAEHSGRGRVFEWTLLDQGLSSATNAGASFVAAGHLSAPAFGRYALATTLGLSAIGVSRSVATDPLVIVHAVSEPELFAEARDAALSTAVWCGVVMSVVIAVVALAIGDALGSTTMAPLLGLAAILPAILLQDALRQGFFTRRPALGQLGRRCQRRGRLMPQRLICGQSVQQLLIGGKHIIQHIVGEQFIYSVPVKDERP